MDNKFVSTVSSNDFDKALNGGLDFAGMKPQVQALIDNPVTDEHINELIDNKLGVIENGTY